MTDAAASKPKKRSIGAKKAPASHPKYSSMVEDAIKALGEKGGSSRQAVQKYIQAHYSVGQDAKIIGYNVKLALKRGATSGVLKQVKGTGASGSFRIASEKPSASGSKVAKKVASKKSPAKKKAKAVKPAVAAKKAKSSPKKATKAKKPKAVKATKAPKSPKPKRAAPAKKKAKAVKKAKTPKKK